VRLTRDLTLANRITDEIYGEVSPGTQGQRLPGKVQRPPRESLILGADAEGLAKATLHHVTRASSLRESALNLVALEYFLGSEVNRVKGLGPSRWQSCGPSQLLESLRSGLPREDNLVTELVTICA
jgi:hypothetical protein